MTKRIRNLQNDGTFLPTLSCEHPFEQRLNVWSKWNPVTWSKMWKLLLQKWPMPYSITLLLIHTIQGRIPTRWGISNQEPTIVITVNRNEIELIGVLIRPKALTVGKVFRQARKYVIRKSKENLGKIHCEEVEKAHNCAKLQKLDRRSTGIPKKAPRRIRSDR